MQYPQSNGKIERWHKTIKGDCIRTRVPLSLDDARRQVTNYVAHYNDVRLHSAIGYVAPRDKLAGREKEIFQARDLKLAEARKRRQELRQGEAVAQATTLPAALPAIDFAAVRAAVSMRDVLRLLGFQPGQASGAQQRGPCPLHGGTAGTARCFSVNVEQQVFHCFKCGRKGNALDLWAAANQQTSYDAAIGLCQRLGIDLPKLDRPAGAIRGSASPRGGILETSTTNTTPPNREDCHVERRVRNAARILHGRCECTFLKDEGTQACRPRNFLCRRSITFSPCWYIRGGTPNCRMRRW